jgi:hypothetical protein
MNEGHAYFEHWKRGALGFMFVGVALITAAFAAMLVTGLLLFLPLELLLSPMRAIALEDHYWKIAWLTLTVIFAPAMLSQGAETTNIIEPWPAEFPRAPAKPPPTSHPG